MRPHLSLNVQNLKKSVTFYQKAFGVKPQKQSKTYAKFDLKKPAFNFSMHEVVGGRTASRVNHLGIEEGTDCCFALQDKFWFEDPDGNSWEIFFVHSQLPVTGAEPPHQVKKATKGGKASDKMSKTDCC